MKTVPCFPSAANRYVACLTIILCACAVLLNVTALAKPRPPGPPWPEIGAIYHEDFDQPMGWPTNQVIDPSIWVESWSGYALNRQRGTTVAPWAIPMLVSNTEWNIDPERGAIRFWYKPSFNTGVGPGSTARLLTLVSTNGANSAVWWTLAISGDGTQIGLVCQNQSGPAACLNAQVLLQADTWYLLTLGYTETNSALFINEQEVAVGEGLASVPVQAAPLTSLIVGSGLRGAEPAAGQIEELTVFTGRKRFHALTDHPFGLSSDWEIFGYYSSYSLVAAMGPVTEAEELAMRERAAAARAARLAAQEAANATTLLSTTDGLSGNGGGMQLDSYDPSQGFWLLTPQILQVTNVLLTLTNNDPSIGYDIYYSPVMGTNLSWSIVATGIVGQATFTVPMNGWQGFYRGAVGGDWDGDTIPNWMDANPTNAILGTLSITIDSPSNGTSLN